MRFFIAAGAGLSVALLLFLLMNTLISGEQSFDRNALGGNLVDFIRVQPDEITRTIKRERPEEPPPPEDPPPPPPMNVADQTRPTAVPLDIELPDIVVPATTGSGPYLGRWSPGDVAADGGIIPISQIPPQYPREALLQGIEGWVKLRFTILPNGAVEGVEVLDSSPRRVFDRSATSAIQRWTFKPRIENGQAVSETGELTIDFELPD